TWHAVSQQPQSTVRACREMIFARTTLLLALLVPTLAAQQPAATAGAPANEWRQFRGSQRHTGVSASTPATTLKLLWTYDAGEIVESSAAIVDDVVYVGSGDGDLLALNLASGTLRWKYV